MGNWRLNPPTISAFVREFVELTTISKFHKDSVLNLCKLQTILAMNDSRLLATKASEIAFAAYLNALDSIGLNKFAIAAIIYTVMDDNYSALRENIKSHLYGALKEKTPKSTKRGNCGNFNKSSTRNRPSF